MISLKYGILKIIHMNAFSKRETSSQIKKHIYIYGYQWGEEGGKGHIKNMGLGDTNYCV